MCPLANVVGDNITLLQPTSRPLFTDVMPSSEQTPFPVYAPWTPLAGRLDERDGWTDGWTRMDDGLVDRSMDDRMEKSEG